MTIRHQARAMAGFTPLSEHRYDEQCLAGDPAAEVEPGPALLDQLLGAGWQVQASYITRHRDNPLGVATGEWYSDKYAAFPRETRVVLVNRALGRKCFGFGSDWEEAFADAAGQIK